MLALLLALACAKQPLPPPAAATGAIALDGHHQTVEAVEESRYLHYAVGASIHAPPEVVWAVLTDASRYTSWNSTIVSLKGDIALGNTIRLTAKIDPKRTFDLTVSTFEAPSAMVWMDGDDKFLGVRTFTLTPNAEGGTDWTMKEAFSGSMLKMIAPKLPDFGPDFDAFAADLKAEAERMAAPAGSPG